MDDVRTRRQELAVEESSVPAELVEFQLVSARALRRVLGRVSRRTFCKWIKAGVLPEPILFEGSNYWRVLVIRPWLQKNFGEDAVDALDRKVAA